MSMPIFRARNATSASDWLRTSINSSQADFSRLRIGLWESGPNENAVTRKRDRSCNSNNCTIK